ncbi:MAG: aldo/keto reductase [Staphylococcus sp.]|nr:aldo/keto reductase [Staphylococcus sp.]
MVTTPFLASADRYERGMKYRRSGHSGILLPEISLGMWHNFGDVDPLARSIEIACHAFDNGITHFDLANNYGPSYGSAEETFGIILKKALAPYRDELFISTKAGYDMWPGPYGNWGSRKYLLASLDQSLRRMGLGYVDLFYSHRYDPVTPEEETLQALVDAVRSGKALYAGISRWPVEAAARAYRYLADRDVPCLIYQGRYNIFDREDETNGIIEGCEASGTGYIAFSPLAQGLLTDRYINGIPADSRIAHGGHLKGSDLTPRTLARIRALNSIAAARGQSLAEMALSWILSDSRVTSVIVGASSVEQLQKNLKAINSAPFSPEELQAIDSAANL